MWGTCSKWQDDHKDLMLLVEIMPPQRYIWNKTETAGLKPAKDFTILRVPENVNTHAPRGSVDGERAGNRDSLDQAAAGGP